MPVDTSSSEYLDFAEIKAGASVRVVLASLGLLDILTPKGEELVGRCMLGGEPHGKKDSFSFNTNNKKFQCFSCKTRGSILDFVAKYEKQGMGLRESAQYIQATMRSAYHLAGEGADDEALVRAITDEVEHASKSEKRLVKKNKKPKAHKCAKQAKKPPATPSLNVVDLQNAVMSWSLASYRVQDGKLNPDDLIVVDVATLEFLRQLATPTSDGVSEGMEAYLRSIPTQKLSQTLAMRLQDRLAKGVKINGAKKARKYFTATLANQPREVFAVMLLDAQNRMIFCETLFYGTIASAKVYPREVVRLMIEHSAVSIIVAHNHPSGHIRPSENDIDITERIKKALNLIEARLLDHIIVGGNKTYSMAEHGLV